MQYYTVVYLGQQGHSKRLHWLSYLRLPSSDRRTELACFCKSPGPTSGSSLSSMPDVELPGDIPSERGGLIVGTDAPRTTSPSLVLGR